MSAKVGRNDPCPCGSGRKYKRCCLGAEQASAAATEAKATFFADTDLQILGEIRRRCPDAYEAAMRCEDSYTFPPDQFLPFWMPLITWESEEADEGPAARTVAASMKSQLSSEQGRYVEAQLDAWFSIWRALDVTPGEGCRVVDELTGVERAVRERSATQMLKVGDAMLVRVVREGASWGFHGMYPRTLPRAHVARIVEYVRFNLDLGELPVDPERLRGEAAFEMANLVNEAIVSLEFDALPEMVDAEGNPLRIVEDSYKFDAGSHPVLVAGLEALDGAHHEDPVEDDEVDCERWVLTQRRQGGDEGVLASLKVGGSWMTLEALSLECADQARAMIEEASGVRLLLGSRESRSPADILAAANNAGVGPPEQPSDPEIDAMLRQVQEQHYARWRDEAIPALGGLTPRQAAAMPGTEVYATLLEVLTSIEELERTRPPGQRFDYAGLRKSLGLS